MYVLIVGGGKVGSHLAKTLHAEGHQVTIIEVDQDRCAILEDLMEGVRIICGDGDEPYVLDEADAASADALVAATGHDEDNLVVALLGKMEYQSPLTVGRINNPSNAWLFTERFGVDVPVSNTAIMADVLKSVSLGDIVTMLASRPRTWSSTRSSFRPRLMRWGRGSPSSRCRRAARSWRSSRAVPWSCHAATRSSRRGTNCSILTRTEHEAELRKVFAANGGRGSVRARSPRTI